MREMTEATYNAIKNRMMTGDSKFTYDVQVDGYTEGYSNIENQITTNFTTPFAHVDFCERSDGKILVAFLSGLSLYLKVVDTEDEFINSPSALDGASLFYTMTEVKNESCFAVHRMKNGKVLLVLCDIGKFGAAQFSTRTYVSDSGNIGDFNQTSTVYSSARASSEKAYIISHVSKPADGSGDAIFFTAGERYTGSGYDMANFACYKSQDFGVTWSKVGGVNNLFLEGSRLTSGDRLTIVDNIMFVTFISTYGLGSTSLFKSEDYGVTWSYSISAFENIPAVIPVRKFLFDKSGTMFCLADYVSGKAKLYRLIHDVKISYTNLNTFANWELVWTDVPIDGWDPGHLVDTISGNIHWHRAYGSSYTHVTLTRIKKGSVFNINSITIAKSHGGANTASLRVDNKDGLVNPRNLNGPLYGILNLNRRVVIKQGYGDDLVDSFTGMIDGIHMSTFPQVADIQLRDNLKRALDQIITKNGSNTVEYSKQPIEAIVEDLCILCGLEIGYIEPTGISIEKSFAFQSYADAFQFLSDIASFEFLADESGKFHFRRDHQPDNMYVAWTFEEGIDITNLTFEINDNDLYNSVRVYGMSGDDVLVYNAPFLDAQEFNILPQKVLKIDATEAGTLTELRRIAERAIATMRSRTRVITFDTVGIPHLQVGDFIQLFESSTNSHDIYRLTSISLNMTPSSFTMSCKAYYYGDAIVPGELPDEIATQTPDPTLNLIPNMTSNTSPSGVARSSSVYKLWNITYSAWRAFNTDDTDYFWDASTKAAWIEYEFPEKTIVDKYIIMARQDLTWNKALPKDWTFEAFDGEKWIVLDTRKDQTSWGIYEERSFLFTNDTPYAKYRLNVTANNGYVRTQIEQLSMYYGGGL